MRLSTDADRDEERGLATITAAVEAGITVFDTARAYGLDETELGHNERLLARALRASGAAASARVVTKGGMTRPGGGWVPDGRAKAIRADCEASLEALDGLAIDLYLLHAPDSRTPWATAVRALGLLVDKGLVRSVGLSNVNRRQLDEALELAPIAAVQVALSPFDDRAMRGGVLERCEELGLTLIAHSPLGGPKRAGRLDRNDALAAAAARADVTAAEAALAWLVGLSPVVVPIPGARRPETARSAARAARVELDAEDRDELSASLGVRRGGAAPTAEGSGDVVLIMGIPGAGKSVLAEEYAARGYVRLNRDERGGTLRELAEALDQALASGAERVVLDNTYLTRASRSYVLEAAGKHGAPVRCIWLDTPLARAQVNMIGRLLERLGSLPEPDAIRSFSRTEPGLLSATSQMRTQRELEPPGDDEGFASVERVEFEQQPAQGTGGVFVAAAALEALGWEEAVAAGDPKAPHLLFDWRPGGAPAQLAPAAERLAAQVSGPVETAVCPHGGGAPECWCRPPLPGLPLAFARTHGVDPTRSLLIGASSAHRTLANALGARYVDATTA